jgi:hypothetical protein
MHNTIRNNRISTSTHWQISTRSTINTRIINCVNNSTNNSINSKTKISSSTRTYPRTCIIYHHKRKRHRITCNNSSTTTSSTDSTTTTITKSNLNLGNANSRKSLNSYIKHKYCLLRCESVFCLYITHDALFGVSFAKDFYKNKRQKSGARRLVRLLGALSHDHVQQQFPLRSYRHTYLCAWRTVMQALTRVVRWSC